MQGSYVQVVPLELSCDTLLLTCSPSFEVKHINCLQETQLPSLIRTHSDKFKIVFLNKSVEAGRALLALAREKEVQAGKEEEKVPLNHTDALIDSMVERAKSKCSLLHAKEQLQDVLCRIVAAEEKLKQSKEQKKLTRTLQQLNKKRDALLSSIQTNSHP